MSYDIYLRDAGGNDVGDPLPDPTYNLTPIFDLALTGEDLPNPEVGEAAVVLFRAKTERPRGLRVLDGKTGAESVPLLAAAVARLHDESLDARFRALEPSNGWGDLDGAREVIEDLHKFALEHQTRTWEIH